MSQDSCIEVRPLTDIAQRNGYTMKLEVSKIDAAVHQLNWAIRLVLDHSEWICAVTLAGAAEEILGKAVKDCSSLNVLKKSMAAEFGTTEAIISQHHLNRLKNWLKHWDDLTKDNKIQFEPDKEAINYIVRAMSNLYVFNKSLPSEGPRFLDWADNHPDIGPLRPTTKAAVANARSQASRDEF